MREILSKWFRIPCGFWPWLSSLYLLIVIIGAPGILNFVMRGDPFRQRSASGDPLRHLSLTTEAGP